MILAFNIADIIQVPFGYLISWLYQLTSNYGVALILFGVLLKLILYPSTVKAKKSTMKMSRLAPRLEVIREKYPNDPQKQNAATQELYKQEGVSMGSGCLWSLVPLLIIIPLYAVVRQPITYLLHESAEVAQKIVEVIKAGSPDLFGSNTYYEQMIAAPLITQYADSLKDIVSNPATLNGINFNFLGVNLGATPSFNIFAWKSYDWATIGAFLIPLLSAGSQVLSMFISQKMNNSLVTDEKGIEDKETAKNSQANQTNKIMLWMMPLMSLWIGFSIPCALSLYWFVQGIAATVIDVIITKKYRKIYDAEDAERLKKALEEEAIAAEKERLRQLRREENPNGITENTSKKKLQQQQREAEAAAKREAAREYAARKGSADTAEASADAEPEALSGIAERPFCKGHAYDPNRYAADHTEES